jgi:hypothetical protein
MDRKWFPLLFLALLVASCATTSGSLLGKAVPLEGAGSRQQRQPVKPNYQPSGVPVTQGLQIVTEPDNAEVYLNGAFQGRTPLVIADLDQGTYRLTIRKSGYYDIDTWIDFPGSYMLFQTPLVRITGFLEISLSPPEASVTVGGNAVSPGVLELPTGPYMVVARAFGYGDYGERVSIAEKALTKLDITLSPAPFSFSSLYSAKSTFSPDNPGTLGTVELDFVVTGPGTGEATVLDSNSLAVFHDTLPEFTTWNYRYLWGLRDSSGRDLPDGEYRFILSGIGKDSTKDRKGISIRIDRGARESYQSQWSGSAGLLYAPSAEVFPDGSFQVSFLGAASLLDSPITAPLQISGRLGIGGVLELDGEAAVILTTGSSPFSFGVAARYPLLKAERPFGFSAAMEAKAAAQWEPAVGIFTTDVFSNFTGLEVSFPMQAVLGPLSILADAGLIASFWQPDDPAIPPQPGFVSWLYLRGGILLNFRELSGGLSIAAHTLPLPGGIASIGLPFQAGLELHWLIPGTHVAISAALLGDVRDGADYSLSGGGGLGFIY